MKEDKHLYSTFIELNESSFARRLFIVAYHALSAALYCALNTQDVVALQQVERLTTQQLKVLNEHFGSQNLQDEPLEITLYTSLLRIVNPRLGILESPTVREGHGIFPKGYGIFGNSESMLDGHETLMDANGAKGESLEGLSDGRPRDNDGSTHSK